MRRFKECTLGIIKPDVSKVKNVEEIVASELAKKNLKIIKTARLNQWKRPLVEEFYQEHKGKFFYQRLIHFMSNGPVTAIVIEGPSAVSTWRDIIGPTHIDKAREKEECLRARFGFSDTKNSFHGSDSVENAEKEIAHFFPNFDLKDQVVQKAKIVY